jgi:hypothetical protein
MSELFRFPTAAPRDPAVERWMNEQANVRHRARLLLQRVAGIHDNYDRYNQFTEREVLPRLAAGPDAFYGPDGHILPMFRVHMDLQQEFASDLRNLTSKAHELRIRLESAR